MITTGISRPLFSFFDVDIDAIKRYSADGMRIACAYAGDSLGDANFTTETADSAILRLYTTIEWAQELVNKQTELREGAPSTFADRVFEAQINHFIELCDVEYEKCDSLTYILGFLSPFFTLN